MGLNLNRRDFLKAGAAAGLVVAFRIPYAAGGRAASFAPNAFVRVDADGRVTVSVPKVEMGQGVRTSLAMIVAEELEADWSSVRVEQATLDATGAFGSLIDYTGGSRSVAQAWEPMRLAGAAAREMLVTAAARAWGVSRAECRAERGAVVHEGGRRLGFGDLASAAAVLPVPGPAEVRLKEPKEFTIVGRPVRRIDGADIVTGRAVYGADTRVPGMLVASIERCPVVGGKVRAFDDARAKAVAGVRHVVAIDNGGATFGDGAWASGVAVVADTTWAAVKGREALEVSWDLGRHAGLSCAAMRSAFARLADDPGINGLHVSRDEGDAPGALAAAARRVDAVYEVPYAAHAPLETMNCIADVRPGRCEIWAPTQAPAAARDLAAETLAIPKEAVTVHTTLVGGGFGRRLRQDYVLEAVKLSKAAGAPVQVVWSRADETRHGFYRPASYHRLAAAVGADGLPEAWAHRVVGPSRAAFNDPKTATPDESFAASHVAYGLPSVRVEYVQAQAPLPLGPWRSVDWSQTVFVVECFVDEIAAASGADPLELRRRLLARRLRQIAERPPKEAGRVALYVERLAGVLELAAARAGWGAPLAPGRGRGIAVCGGQGGFVAEVAEVTVAPSGEVRVDRVVCAIDCGTAINPDTIAAQMEGSVAFGLSAALKGEITVERGRVVQSSYRDYDVVRMRDMPVVETHIVPSSRPPGGVGEPAVPPVAPAVANAIFGATGKRVRRMPIGRLTPEDAEDTETT